MKLFNKSIDVYEMIFDFLNRDNLLGNNIDGFLNELDKKFHDYRSISKNIFDELSKLVEENPQMIIDKIKSFVSETEELTTLFVHAKREYHTVKDKMDFISLIWETSSLLNFTVFLKTNGRIILNAPYSAKTILSHFRDMNLTSHHIELARKIRNANDHTFTVNRNSIVFKDEEISLQDIDDVFQKLENLSSWWNTLITITIYYNPKFGLLFLYSLFRVWHSDLIKYKFWIDGLKNFAPDLVKQDLRGKNKKNKFIPGFIKSKIIFLKSRKEKRRLSKEYLNKVFERIKYHSDSIRSQTDLIVDKLAENDDKEKLARFSKWLGKIEKSLSEISEEMIIDFLENLKRTEGKEVKYYNKGVRLLNSGKSESAIKYFSKALKIKPSFSKLLHYRASSFFKINEYTKSIQDCDRYLEQRKDNSKVYYLRGLNYYYLDEYENAKTDFESAIKISQYYKEAIYFRGICKLKLNNKEEGCKDIRMAKDLDYPIDEHIAEICQ